MTVNWKPGITISSTPLRKVVGRSSPITNGWGRTNKNPIGYCGGESPGELEFLMYAEMDPNVTVIMPQACIVPYSHEGKLRRHCPDFAIIERCESLIFEIKSRRQFDKPDVHSKLRSAARSIESVGWPYFVTLKEDILTDRRYPNVFDLWRWFRPTFDDIQRMAIEESVSKGERVVADVVRELDASMGNRAPSVERILSLAANGGIFIDLDSPVGAGSVIRAADPASLPEPLIPRRRLAHEPAPQVAA